MKVRDQFERSARLTAKREEKEKVVLRNLKESLQEKKERAKQVIEKQRQTTAKVHILTLSTVREGY